MAKSPAIARRDLSSLRFVLCAAAPMPGELIEVLRRNWKVGYAESYGLTETSPVITICSTGRFSAPVRAAGRWATPGSRWPTRSATPCPSARSVNSGRHGTAISAGDHHRPEATS